MSEATIRILIADDHPIVRHGLAALIDRQPGMSIVAEASNGVEVVELFRQYQPDVSLVDLRMPQRDGASAIAQICQEFPAARILVLSTYDRDEDIYRGLQAGAMGYLLKDVEPVELFGAIRALHAGIKHIPPSVGAKLVQRLGNPELSDREREVVKLLAMGKSNAEIATELHISESTVKFHLNRIMTKWKVSDRVQIVVAALKRGLVSL